MKWSEQQIAAFLCRNTFDRKHLVIVPNCTWPGSECDLLVVTTDRRVIDVEIKISRSDLRADARKDKWFHGWNFRTDGPWSGDYDKRRRREWPRKVWKHYYAMPREIWTPELLTAIPKASGVLLIYEHKSGGALMISCERRAKPNRDCERISADDALDIARLASLRMWDAYDATARIVSENNVLRQRTAA